MAITRKPGPAQSVALLGQIPEPPLVPSPVLERFPEMLQWQSDFKAWWQKFSDMFSRDRSSITAQFQKDEADAASQQTTIQNQITTITNQLTALAGQISGGGVSALAGQVATLTAQLLALTATFNNHKAASVVHGTASNVVGESDVENLDAKTIGQGIPGYGRFQPLLGSNLILPTQNVLVSATDFMITTGHLLILGALKIDGVLLVL